MEEDDAILEEINLDDLLCFDRHHNTVAVPAEYTSAVLHLDARPSASLNWQEEFKQAEALIRNGKKILFELELAPFQYEGQIQTLVLALDEFRLRFLAHFHSDTVGVILYRGNVFTTLDERDLKMDLLDTLRLELPDSVPVFLLFDCKEIADPFMLSRLVAFDRYTLFQLALQNCPLPLHSFRWQEGQLSAPLEQTAQIGLLMPRHDKVAGSKIKKTLSSLLDQRFAFKLIAEELLPLEWNGLDVILTDKQNLDPTTLRALAGFVAAGGIVTEID